MSQSSDLRPPDFNSSFSAFLKALLREIFACFNTACLQLFILQFTQLLTFYKGDAILFYLLLKIIIFTVLLVSLKLILPTDRNFSLELNLSPFF
jgi:hypothetical protein